MIRTIWVNGCFDVLHHGHLRLLKHAATLGDRLVVGIDSDDRVRSMKGEGRPINGHAFRKELLESFSFIDKVYVFESDHQLEEYIRMNSPHAMVIGDDYYDRQDSIIGRRECEMIVFFRKVPNLSTTETIKKIRNG